MPEPRTKPTRVSVTSHLNAIEDEVRRRDCRTLSALMKRVTGATPRMWGPSIVGFGSYHYKYASGHEGDSCLVGFASGRAHISVYLAPGFDCPATKSLLAKLGKHKAAKGCLYVNKLADVHLDVLEELVEWSVAELKRRYPAGERG